MSDVPGWLQRARRRVVERHVERPPVQAQEPFPFPMRGPQQDWERGSTIGGTVRLPRRPDSGAGMVANAPQEQRLSRGQRPSLLSQYANVVPVQGLMDLGGFIGEQAMRAPGRMLRGEPTNAMPPPPAPGIPPTIGPPTNYEGTPPPFPFMAGDQMRGQSFAEVYDPSRSREAAPRSAPYGGSRFAPPDAVPPEQAARTLAEEENRAWNEAVYAASARRAAEREVANQEIDRQAREGAAAFSRGGVPQRRPVGSGSRR